MLLNYDKFLGQNLFIPSHELPNGLGQSSVNTYIEDGRLVPIKEEGIHDPSKTFLNTTNSIYLHKNILTDASKWQEFTTKRQVIRHPVGSDIYQRIYYVESNKIKFLTYDSSYEYDLLLPQPNPQDQLTVNVTNTGDIQRFLAYTFVTDFGEESALSLTETGTGNYMFGNYYITNLSDTSTITVTWNAANILTVGAGNYNGKITKIRFYMTALGTTTDDFRFVGETTIAAQTFAIPNAGSDAPLKNILTTPVKLTYSDYSTISLIGVCKTIFGSIITFDKSNLYISDPYQPFSFNGANIYSVESEIKGVFPYGNNIIVLTTTIPYILTGNSPDNMYIEKAEKGRSTDNIDCVVNTDDYVVFPTDEGVYVVSTGEFTLATSTMISKQAWRTLTNNGAFLRSALHYKNWYLLSLTSGKTLVFDFKNGFFSELDMIIHCGYYDSVDQILYMLDTDRLLSRLYTFNEGATYKTATVKSRRVILNKPYSLKYLRILADTYTPNIVVKMYWDGVLRATIVCSSDKIFKLPSLATREVECIIETDTIVRNLIVSDNIREIQSI